MLALGGLIKIKNMLKFMARRFLRVLVALSLVLVVAAPGMAIDNSIDPSATRFISNTMNCLACVPVAPGAGHSICLQLPCFNLVEETKIISPALANGILYSLQFGRLPEGLDFKPPTHPV